MYKYLTHWMHDLLHNGYLLYCGAAVNYLDWTGVREVTDRILPDVDISFVLFYELFIAHNV